MTDMSKLRVLLVDDEEKKLIPLLKPGLTRHGFEVESEEFAENALKRIKSAKFDAVLLDVWYGPIDTSVNKGKETYAQIKRYDPDLPVMVFTSTLVDAQKLDTKDYPGAYFFGKSELDTRKYADPYAHLAKDLRRVIEEASQASIPLDQRVGFFVGKSEAMKKAAELVLRLARVDLTVLVSGENGTGKGLVAKAIHRLSRDVRPFVKVDCSAFAETLIESELFGHERGSFTGASVRRIGRFEAAEDGTVFLDEIGNVTPPVQAKLLGVLADREFERVGGTRKICFEARLIAATNTDLAGMVESGNFRRDLYHRLKVAEIHLPPLRERLGDIPDLYAFIISKKNEELRKAFATEIREDVLQLLQSYAWPGNVREFEHAIEAAMVKCQANVLTLDAFNLGQRMPAGAVLSVEQAVSKVLNKELSWDTIKEKGNKRKSDFVKQLINRVIERIDGGVTQDILAEYLCTTPDIVKQILKVNGISLRATKKSLKKIA